MHLQIHGASNYSIRGIDEIDDFLNLAEILEYFKGNNEQLLLSFPKSALDQNLNTEPGQYRKQFIEKRIIWTSDEWLFPYPPPRGYSPTMIWYEPKNREEIATSIKFDQLFVCVVVPRAKPVIKASYVLKIYESDEEDVLQIYEAKHNDFLVRVLPRIKEFCDSLGVELK